MTAENRHEQHPPNATRFLNAFQKVESHLRRKVDRSERPTFCGLVDVVGRSDRSVKHFSTDLKEFADLRNAIIHERTDGHVIAEPSDRTVRDIERIAALLVEPPRVIPHFQKTVSTLKLSDSVADAVKVMLDRSFSQIPIEGERGFVALLTTDTVARWLGSSIETDIFSLSETTIESVLLFSEYKDNYRLVSAASNIFDALEEFRQYEQKGKRLDAILISQNGRLGEGLLGIVTTWDIPSICRMLEHRALPSG